MAIRFFAIPTHQLAAEPQALPAHELVEPQLPSVQGIVERALAGAEFRDMRARDRLRTLLSNDVNGKLPGPGPDCSQSAIFARPPQDLPALLRLADQLDSLARQDEGERALVWQCSECGTRYAVPVALVRKVAIRCERCGKPVELHAERAMAEEALVDPMRSAVNNVRHALADFFREAMARGWPVLVCTAASN